MYLLVTMDGHNNGDIGDVLNLCLETLDYMRNTILQKTKLAMISIENEIANTLEFKSVVECLRPKNKNKYSTFIRFSSFFILIYKIRVILLLCLTFVNN